MNSHQYKGCIFLFLTYFTVIFLKFFDSDPWQEIHMYTHTPPPPTHTQMKPKQSSNTFLLLAMVFFIYIFSLLSFLLLKQILCKPLNELHNVAIARKPRFHRIGITLQGGFPKTRESDKHISLHFCSHLPPMWLAISESPNSCLDMVKIFSKFL